MCLAAVTEIDKYVTIILFVCIEMFNKEKNDLCFYDNK